MSSQEPATHIRQAIRTFQYGLHVLTCGQDTKAHAATISWVTQISFQPRRVAISVRRDSHIYPVVQAQGSFALNVIGQGQEELASTFFKYVAPDGQEFAGHPFEAGPITGSPLLLEALAWLECRVVEEVNAEGDHGLFVADVLAGALRQPTKKPLHLGSTHWSYGG